MALVGINQYQSDPQKESTLDKVFKGVQIAQGVMGTTLAIPKFLQDREEFKLRQADIQSTQDYRRAQVGKFGAEQAQIEADSAPVSDAETSWFKDQGVPEAALPRTVGQARGLAEKLIETPAQKESRQYRDLSLGFQSEAAARAGRTEERAVENTSYQRLKEQEEKAKKEQEEFEEKYIPGIGLAYTVVDAKDLKDGVEQKAKFDRQIQEMIDLREKFGFEIANRAAVARGKQLSKDLLLTYKNMAKLGVLSKSDEDIVNAIIPADPLGATLPGQGPDPILTMLTKFKQDLSLDFNTRVKNRVKVPDHAIVGKQPALSAEDAAALQWANANANDPRAIQIKQRLGAK